MNIVGFNQDRDAGDSIEINFGGAIESLKFVWCPPGTLLLGSPDGPGGPYFENTEPMPKVTFSIGFWIASHPLTRQAANFISNSRPGIGISYETSEYSPASQLTWMEAYELCEQLSVKIHENSRIATLKDTDDFRITLPSQAQWEYAAKAGTDDKWFFGNDESQLNQFTWYDDPTGQLPEVGLKKPNPWGIYDLYGMVYEWCLDHDLPYTFFP